MLQGTGQFFLRCAETHLYVCNLARGTRLSQHSTSRTLVSVENNCRMAEIIRTGSLAGLLFGG